MDRNFPINYEFLPNRPKLAKVFIIVPDCFARVCCHWSVPHAANPVRRVRPGWTAGAFALGPGKRPRVKGPRALGPGKGPGERALGPGPLGQKGPKKVLGPWAREKAPAGSLGQLGPRPWAWKKARTKGPLGEMAQGPQTL